MFALDNVISMTTVAWTSRNLGQYLSHLFFLIRTPSICRNFLNPRAALVAEVASQSPQATTTSWPFKAMKCLHILYPFWEHFRCKVVSLPAESRFHAVMVTLESCTGTVGALSASSSAATEATGFPFPHHHSTLLNEISERVVFNIM